jgi:hypothetical protein
MKKSKIVSLVLITAALASCHKHKKISELKDPLPTVYMRSDSTAEYSQATGDYWMWHYAFRPYGLYYGGYYRHAGYYSDAISESSNIGHSSFKGGVVRGGFGGSHSFSVSS